MKKYLLLVVVLSTIASINAQNNNQLDSVVSANAFITLPLQPHKKSVDVFFNCDKPKQPFYNIRVIDVRGGNSYQDLLSALQEKAKEEGFDGVIILDKSTSLTQDNSATTALVTGLAQATAAAIAGKNSNDYHRYEPFFTTVNILSAIGLKYKTNMQYVSTIVKKAVVKAATTDTIYFTINGELIKDNPSASNFYENNIHLFERCDYFASHAMHESTSKYSFDVDFSTTIKVDNPFGDGNIRYKVLYYK